MKREDTLELAKQCVMKDRQTTYGTPENNFRTIAELWGAYLGTSFSPVQVAMMMLLLKVARQKNCTTYADNYVDIAGYAACASELADPSVEVGKFSWANEGEVEGLMQAKVVPL